MVRRSKLRPLIAVDTRESRPYTGFPQWVRRTLKTGDYQLAEYPELAVLERKASISDLARSLGRGRRRFVRELERMAAFRYRALLIEPSLADLCTLAGYRGNLSAVQIVNGTLALCIRHRIQLLFAGSRDLGELLTYRWLQHCLAEHLRHVPSA